jgi:hypothetical protein
MASLSDTLRAKPGDQILDVTMATVMIIKRGRIGRHRGFDDKLALHAER